MSLKTHLTTPDIVAHQRLPFDERCPLCRDARLAGRLPDPADVPATAKDGLAAGLVAAVTAAAPAAAAASGGAGQPPGASEPATAAPAETAQPATPPALAPTEPGSPSVTSSPTTSMASSQTPIGAPGQQPPPTPATEPSSTANAGEPPPQLAEAPLRDGASAPAPTTDQGLAADLARDATVARKHPLEFDPYSSDPHPSDPHPTRATMPPAGSDLHIHDGAYTVQAGDSLWTIAHHWLGREATDAQIARAVSRIWDHNAAAVGTGNPNLIVPGDRLEMPS